MTHSQFRKYVSEKVKEAKANGFAWLSWENQRMKIVPPNDNNLFGGWMIVKFRSRIYLDLMGRRKDTGPLMTNLGKKCFMVQDKAVMAVVEEKYPCR